MGSHPSSHPLSSPRVLSAVKGLTKMCHNMIYLLVGQYYWGVNNSMQHQNLEKKLGKVLPIFSTSQAILTIFWACIVAKEVFFLNIVADK